MLLTRVINTSCCDNIWMSHTHIFFIRNTLCKQQQQENEIVYVETSIGPHASPFSTNKFLLVVKTLLVITMSTKSVVEAYDRSITISKINSYKKHACPCHSLCECTQTNHPFCLLRLFLVMYVELYSFYTLPEWIMRRPNRKVNPIWAREWE